MGPERGRAYSFLALCRLIAPHAEVSAAALSCRPKHATILRNAQPSPSLCSHVPRPGGPQLPPHFGCFPTRRSREVLDCDGQNVNPRLSATASRSLLLSPRHLLLSAE